MLFKTKCYLVVAFTPRSETIVAIADTQEEAIAFAVGSDEAMKLVETTDVYAFSVSERDLFEVFWQDVEAQKAEAKFAAVTPTHNAFGNS